MSRRFPECLPCLAQVGEKMALVCGRSRGGYELWLLVFGSLSSAGFLCWEWESSGRGCGQAGVGVGRAQSLGWLYQSSQPCSFPDTEHSLLQIELRVGLEGIICAQSKEQPC